MLFIGSVTALVFIRSGYCGYFQKNSTYNLINTSKVGKVTSDIPATTLSIKLSRVNHHLRNFIDAGLVYRKKRSLYLRGGSLKAAVCEMRKDSEWIFDELEMMAEVIDDEVGLKCRSH
jgi:predicted transcriptional regulator